jgi:Spy/CpxP family protein refolding chaperone
MTKSRRPLFVALFLAAGAAATSLPACNSAPEQEAPPVQQEVGRHRHGAVNAVIDAAIAHGDLTDAQLETITAIRDEVKAQHHDRKAFREEMRVAASEIVRSGTTDSEQFDAMVEKAATAIEERVQLSSSAVKEIHGLLSPDQRVAVAEALRNRIDARWGKARRDRHEAFEKFSEELMLTDEQVAGIEKVRKEMLGEAKRLRPTAEELYDLVDAFETEQFAEALDAFHADKGPLLREKLATAGDHADTVLGLLETDQRDVLAQLIEEGPEAFHDEQTRAAN